MQTNQPQVENGHWVEQLAERAIASSPGPYTITAGMTTSGPAHMGTLCEMLYPQAIARHMKACGKQVRYLFIADIMDAFDSVPMDMAKFEKELTPHLGKPLYDVLDPLGCHNSFGEHYLALSFELGKSFGIAPEILRAQELYVSGAMDKYAKLYIEKIEQVKELVGRTSLKPEMPKDWHPLMPICEKCGKIATTRVTRADSSSYAYSCDKDTKYVKGCGHSGSNKISDHKYKITWRLHWPTWMDHLGTSIEGAGMDHHTRGGSWDTCQAVFREIFGKEPPIGYKFGFVLFQGKKYSKSKGIGMSVEDLLKIMPSDVLAFALLRPDLEENRDINPTAENLQRLIGEFEEAGKLSLELKSNPSLEISRANKKRALAFEVSAHIPVWKVSFPDLMIYYNLYHNWDDVAAKLGSPGDVRRLAPYVEEWQRQNLVPEDYRFSFNPTKSDDPLVQKWAQNLNEGMDSLKIHNSVFEIAKANGAKPGELFQKLYSNMLGKPHGPKLGKLVEIIGVKKVKDSIL